MSQPNDSRVSPVGAATPTEDDERLPPVEWILAQDGGGVPAGASGSPAVSVPASDEDREHRVLELAAKKIDDMAADADRRGHRASGRAHRDHAKELRMLARNLAAKKNEQS